MDLQGIILKSTPFRDADLILHVLTPNMGKLSVMARSGRSSKKRYGTQLEPFDLGTFTLKKGRGNFFLIDNFIAKKAHKKLREDLDKLTLASLACEVTDKLLVEEMNEDTEQIFEMLCFALNEIEEGDSLKVDLKTTYTYLTLLLTLSGFMDSETTPPPSANNLRRLLGDIENSIETELKTRGTIEMILRQLKRSEPPAPSLT